ncbi:MAG: FAD-dependent oxidoreductase [Polyangiaceae bacterium]
MAEESGSTRDGASTTQEGAAPELDVIIIGAGFTGISAARELKELGASFRVLEAFDTHLGGRAYAYDAKHASDTPPPQVAGLPLRFDHGAEYIGDLQNSIMSIIREYLPKEALVNGANLRHPYPYQVMVLDQKRHVFRLDQSLFGITGIPPDLGIAAGIAVVGLLAEMTLVEIQINVLEPWNAPDYLRELDKIDCWSWLNQKDWVPASVKDLLRISIEALLSVEPSEISPYYLLWYTACNSGFVNEVNDDAGGPQQYWLSCGMSTLAELYATPVRDHIEQGVSVKHIDLSGPKCKVTTQSGETLVAKKVLVAMSPHTAGKIAYTPEPAPARKELMGLPMGRTLKCQVYYKSSWWHDSQGTHFNGYCGGANNPVLWVMDNSPPPGTDDETHVLMTFTVGAQLDALGPNPSLQQIETSVTGAIRDMFQDNRALAGSSEYLRLVPFTWSAAEKVIGGGPNTVFTPGALTSDVGRMLNAHWDDKVFFASAENSIKLDPIAKSPHWSPFNPDNKPKYTEDGILLPDPAPPYSTDYSDWRENLGYMDGALVSGKYVAHEIAQSLGLAHKLPARPDGAATKHDIPPVSAHPTDRIVSVLERVKSAVDDVSKEDIRRWTTSPAGPKGFASWLHHQLESALDADGDGKIDDPVKRLTRIRDFAITSLNYLNPAMQPRADDPLDKIQRVLADADKLLKQKLGLH